MNLEYKKQWIASWAIFVFIYALLPISFAFAKNKIYSEQRVDIEQAQGMAKQAAKTSKIPIVVNDLVLEELNRFLNTTSGRKFIKESLARMEAFRPMLERELDSAHLPKELMVIPIIESGYRNLPEAEKSAHGAGLWMFIKSTARAFGMRVDNTVDERLNVEKETGAALRYLKKNYHRFQDWHLALMAYNMGENSLEKSMKELNTKDPWELIRAKKENDSGYLAKCLAAILILKNPEMI